MKVSGVQKINIVINFEVFYRTQNLIFWNISLYFCP